MRERGFAPDSLRLVFAPKRSTWQVRKQRWSPQQGKSVGIRPLAHATVRDQVFGTAFLICLANIAETVQGDPTKPPEQAIAGGTASYGNRLFCDYELDGLHFRWGNSDTYRKWFTDYRAFIKRPKAVIADQFREDRNWAEIRTDLAQFYDRVRPSLLYKKVAALVGPSADPDFLHAFRRFFDWQWDAEDSKEAEDYAARCEPPIQGFSHIALPQGLVASGFFANMVLTDFDQALRTARGSKPVGSDWELVDYVRYVDDLRLVLRVGKSSEAQQLKEEVTRWLQNLLTLYAPELLINLNKTEVVLGRDPARLIPVSDRMALVGENVSGPFAATTGQETLDLLDGLIATQPGPRLGPESKAGAKNEPLAIEEVLCDDLDVRPDTVARFSANRWLTTFRTLRRVCEEESAVSGTSGATGLPTRRSLDERADVFARNLLRKWVFDPSNIRLLLIAFDLNPHPDTLAAVTELLLQYFRPGPQNKRARCICSYVSAELFRAGATRTGHVANAVEDLPKRSDLAGYWQALADFAEKLVGKVNVPWYLRQQAALFMAFMQRPLPGGTNLGNGALFEPYDALLRMMLGEVPDRPPVEFVALLLVLGQMTGSLEKPTVLALGWMRGHLDRSHELIDLLLTEFTPLAEAVWDAATDVEREGWRPRFAAFGFGRLQQFPRSVSERANLKGTFGLMDVAMSPQSPLRHEFGAIQLLRGLLRSWKDDGQDTLTPWRVDLACNNWGDVTKAHALADPNFLKVSVSSPGNAIGFDDKRYRLPHWWDKSTRWRHQLGQVMRAVLTADCDFTHGNPTSAFAVHLPRYSGILSSLEQRRHGLALGRLALGGDWLPVSSWLVDLAARLLEWPGMGSRPSEDGANEIGEPPGLSRFIEQRADALQTLFGRASETPFLPARMNLGKARFPDGLLRVAVVQTVLPRESEFKKFGPELNDVPYRRRHRRHLGALVKALTALLGVRRTHIEDYRKVDLVVFPELAVHADDVGPIIERFADQQQCIVFCGLVFHRVSENLVNSGVWVIPDRSSERRTLHRYEQGKLHLTPEETDAGVVPFRPCQWLLEYVDSVTRKVLWRMTASICYDATDLHLAADLRDRTDAYIVSALNKDVGTFDSMVQALHYHMFQHVILVNSGQYGGSVVQAPFKQAYERTVLHHHGLEQAVVSFFELELEAYRKPRKTPAEQEERGPQVRELKTPPAGYSGRIY